MLFIGNFGGLLGLCLGFSLVNIVEIAYFATVRLYQNISLVNSSEHNPQEILVNKLNTKEEERRIRDMYVNDFRKYDGKIYNNLTLADQIINE